MSLTRTNNVIMYSSYLQLYFELMLCFVSDHLKLMCSLNLGIIITVKLNASDSCIFMCTVSLYVEPLFAFYVSSME